MSLDKAIQHRKERRKLDIGSKSIDYTYHRKYSKKL